MAIESDLKENLIEKEKKIILEIGTGELPIVSHNSGIGKKIRDDAENLYIALEETRDIEESKKESQYRKWKGVHDLRTLFIKGDAIHAPFKDNTIDEVILRNVVGDPDIKLLHLIIPEINRILKRQGQMTIVELYTPDVARKFFERFNTKNYFEKPEFIEDMNVVNEYFGGLASGLEKEKPFVCKFFKKAKR